MEIKLPCHNSHVLLHLENKYLNGVLQPHALGITSTDQREIVCSAMKHPFGGKKLDDLAKGCNSAVIICSDHTRPVPSKVILPVLLESLHRANPSIDITLLIATGFHRGTTRGELLNKFGEDILNRERIIVHDSTDESMLVHMGALPSGAEFTVNRLAVETDLLLAEGFIEPHFFAGFSGGRKSVLPGICGRKTILGNHCAEFIDSPLARTGILQGNPIHTDMIAAARMVNLRFILNVVLNANKEVVAAFAGDALQAHLEGCRFLASICGVTALPADVVVVTNGGYPLDQNIYQCVKGLTAAEATAKEGAVIIMVAGCVDGTGGDDFYKTLRDTASPAALLAEISRTPSEETKPDQWESQILARILDKHVVILAASCCNRRIVEDMKMLWAPTISGAVDMARWIKGGDASFTVIPDGVSVIIEK